MRPGAYDMTEASVTLSASDPRIDGVAHAVARHARPLLRAGRAQLLSLTIPCDRRSPPVAMCWAGASQPVALRATLALGDVAVRDTLLRFEGAGRRLLVMLIRRWPANAAPPMIGIVTDGGGVLFSSDHPSPLRPDWLALHQAGLCAPTALRAFSEAGGWARMTGRVADQRLH
jgi:hypothetical protein